MTTTGSTVNESVVSQVVHNVVQDVLSPAAVAVSAAVSQDVKGYTVKQGFEDLFQRDALIWRQAISDADDENVPLLAYKDPHRMFLDLPFIVKKTAGYRAFRGDLVITARANCPGFCSGMYVLQAICDGGIPQALVERDGLARDNVYTSMQDTFGILNMELCNTVELRLPWVSWKNWHDLLSGDAGPQCWRLQLYAAAAMQSATMASCSGVIEIFARLEPGFELANLVYEAETRFPVSHNRGAGASSSTGSLSGRTGTLARGVSLLGDALPVIAPLTTPISTALEIASGVASFFGFTREAAAGPPTITAKRLFSNMTAVDALDTSETVGLYQSNALSPDPRPGGGEGEDVSSLESLYERWTMVRRFAIADTVPIGQILTQNVPVTPFWGTFDGTGYFLPLAGYVGLPFANWHGDMEYLIYVVSGATTKGRLLVTYQERAAHTQVMANDPSQQVTNVSIDLAGSSATLLRVAMGTAKPALRPFVANQVSNAWDDRNCNGTLGFWLQAPVVTSKTTGYSVKIIVMARAASNMKFGVPTNTTCDGGGNTRPLTNIKLESEDVAPLVPLRPQFMARTAPEFPVKEVLWGEGFGSVRALMQRFTNVAFGKPYAVDDPASFSIVHYMPPPGDIALTAGVTDSAYCQINIAGVAPAGTTRVPFSWFGYYSALFTGIRGSSRVKLTHSGSTPIQWIGWAPREYDADMVRNGANQMIDPTTLRENFAIGSAQSVNRENGGEWTFPAYTSDVYQQPRCAGGIQTNLSTSSYTPPLDSFSSRDITTTVTQAVYYAGGPDLAMVRFRRTPRIVFRD